MDFKKKTVEEMLTWLERKGYDEWIREVFEENEVDGRAFLLLTKNHMKELVTRIGPRVKLIDEQAKLRQLDSQVICNVAEYSCYEEIHDEDSDDNNDDRLVDDDKDDHKLHNDNDDHKHDHQDDDHHKLYNENDHKLYDDNDDHKLYNDNDNHKLYGDNDDDRLYDDNDDHHHKFHQDDDDNHKLGNYKDDHKVYDDDHKLDDHKLDDKDGQGDKVDISNIDVAEQIAMFCTDKNRDHQDHYKDKDQGGSVMLQSPVKDCERSSVYTPAQSNSSSMLSEDDDSVIFPSDMSADEDFNATDFPSPSDASSDEGRKQGNTKKLKKIPKKRRKASVDSDDLSDDYNENPMTNCTVLSCGNKRAAKKHRKAAINYSRWNAKGDRLLPDHRTNVGVKKPSKKFQKKNFISKKKTTKRSSLPIPFKLPKHFPKFVKKELSTGVLSGKARTRLVFIVAVAMFEHTPYPTKEEYDHVARQIVKKYEFMSDDKGSHEYIIKLLEDKLTYLRNCKTKQTYTYQPSRRRRCSMFTPKPPVLQSSAGSSSAAYEMYLKIFRQQGERPNPDKAVVMDLMKKTFYMRRQNILKASTSVADLLKTFPCLRSHIQILAEFNRIMGRDMLAVYREQWNTLMPNILAVAMKEKDNIPVQTAIKVAGHHLTDDHKSILALYCLCYLLREVGKKADHQHIITFIPEKANVKLAARDVITEEPTIVVRGNIAQLKDAYLVVEREVLCKLPNMLKVPLILLASYYVFNKTHIGPFSNLFVLMEYYLMRRSIPRKKTRVQLFLAQLAHVNDQS